MLTFMQIQIRPAVSYFFDAAIYFPKSSIIAFYYTFVPPTQPHIRMALYILAAITTVNFLVPFLDCTFCCVPCI